MKELFIFGAGDLAEIAADAFSSLEHYMLKQFIVSDDIYNSKFVLNPFLEGIEIVSESNFLEQGNHNDSYFFAAVGYSKLNKARESIYFKMKSYGLHAATYISKNACIGSKVSIGEGSLVLEENNIQYQAKIGRCVIMWSGNHVGHHSSVGDFAFVTSHVVISGRVNIGNHTFLAPFHICWNKRHLFFKGLPDHQTLLACSEENCSNTAKILAVAPNFPYGKS